ncbi:avidin-like [Pristis pectinata]|uniref:avidin-like n=1 Tax=Pristis pectinata TaxID=685728 RepID=UPI00223E17F4|nr:avidin-like [Pristis pectinata]
MRGALLCLTLLYALGTASASGTIVAPNLAGCWTNQLGSTVSIEVAEDGTLRGTYTSQVSSTGDQVKGDLIGYQQMFNQPTFGFAVKWTTESVRGSVTVWTGQMFNTHGHQTLMTMWLLRNNTETIGNNWSATRTGQDVFRHCGVKCESTEGSGDLGSQWKCDSSVGA